jgi:hypothetical protein
MKQNHDDENSGGIRINGNVTGSNVNVGGSNVSQSIVDNSKGDSVQTAFGSIFNEVDKLVDAPLKEDVIEILQKLQKEAYKGEQANEKRVQSWMNFLAEMVPDIGEVAVRTFINPIDGVSSVFQKVAKRAKNKT